MKSPDHLSRHISVLAILALLSFGGSHVASPVIAHAHPTAIPMMQADRCASPPNPIVAENCLPGTDEWVITNYFEDIAGYTSLTGVNVGEDVDFFVESDEALFDILIFRSGYYGGMGARLVTSLSDVAGQRQPACTNESDTGLTTCSSWISSARLTIPDDWVSGIYFAKLIRHDTGGQNYIPFVVRNDLRDSDILYQQSVTTFHAYNNYGGKSLYTSSSDFCYTIADAPRAVEVSLNRPYRQPFDVPNMYFHVEYPMVRWLEQQGYDVTYSTNMDTHRSGQPGNHNELLDHRLFLSVGHDEYWSQEMRDAITAARDEGVHYGNFSANTAYWRVRFEPDPITGEPETVMVNYKTTESGPPDPSGHATGTWRDPLGADDPEHSLLGVQYIGDNDRFFFPLQVSAEQAADPIFRNTGLQDMPPGSYVNIGTELVGWEWDGVVDDGRSPDGLTVLMETPVYGMLLQDAGNFANGDLSQALIHTTRYIAPSGAIVFSSGTIQWSWGLGARGIEAVEPDPYIPQITYNLFADMGVQPAAPDDSLILDGEDREAPPPTNILFPGEDVPTISNVQVSADETTATITWVTDRPATGQLWTGPRAGHVIYADGLHRDYTTNHAITLSDLVPNTVYYYRVASVDENWQITLSDEGSFQTTSGSLPSQLTYAARLGWRSGRCWVQANTPLAAGIGAGAAALVIAGTWLIVRRIRRRSINST